MVVAQFDRFDDHEISVWLITVSALLNSTNRMQRLSFKAAGLT